MGVVMTFLVAGLNYLIPPATAGQAMALKLLGCFYAGWGIGQCLRLIYPEK